MTNNLPDRISNPDHIIDFRNLQREHVDQVLSSFQIRMQKVVHEMLHQFFSTIEINEKHYTREEVLQICDFQSVLDEIVEAIQMLEQGFEAQTWSTLLQRSAHHRDREKKFSDIFDADRTYNHMVNSIYNMASEHPSDTQETVMDKVSVQFSESAKGYYAGLCYRMTEALQTMALGAIPFTEKNQKYNVLVEWWRKIRGQV